MTAWLSPKDYIAPASLENSGLSVVQRNRVKEPSNIKSLLLFFAGVGVTLSLCLSLGMFALHQQDLNLINKAKAAYGITLSEEQYSQLTRTGQVEVTYKGRKTVASLETLTRDRIELSFANN